MEANNVATLLGGIVTKVKMRDGSPEEVTIRQLPVNMMHRLLQCIDDEPGLVELFCDKPKDWSLHLELQDFERIVVEGEKVNQDFFSRWVQRRIQRQERLVPGMMEKAVTAALASPNTSLKLPSAAA